MTDPVTYVGIIPQPSGLSELSAQKKISNQPIEAFRKFSVASQGLPTPSPRMKSSADWILAQTQESPVFSLKRRLSEDISSRTSKHQRVKKRTLFLYPKWNTLFF